MMNFEPCAAEVMRQFTAIAGGVALEVGGGVAGFTAPGSFLNGVKGLDGKVGRAELQRILEFFADRGEDAVVELAPWVAEACAADLVDLGFVRHAEELVMARPSGEEELRAELAEDLAEWSRVLSIAFFGEWNPVGAWVGKLMSGMKNVLCLGLRNGDQWVAASQVAWIEGMALLAGDGTLPAWRGQGLQQVLIRDRVGRAWRQGIEWCHAEVLPGSSSHRNYLRSGFAEVYPRIHYRKSFA